MEVNSTDVPAKTNRIWAVSKCTHARSLHILFFSPVGGSEGSWIYFEAICKLFKDRIWKHCVFLAMGGWCLLSLGEHKWGMTRWGGLMCCRWSQFQGGAWALSMPPYQLERSLSGRHQSCQRGAHVPLHPPTHHLCSWLKFFHATIEGKTAQWEDMVCSVVEVLDWDLENLISFSAVSGFPKQVTHLGT